MIDIDARSTSPPSVTDGATPAMASSFSLFASDAERLGWLIRTLCESGCRKVGVFRILEALTLSVVIPVYNERATIQEILRRVRAVPIKEEIIVVDDCSKDGTSEIMRVGPDQWGLEGRRP
jgi:hypothetical protein